MLSHSTAHHIATEYSRSFDSKSVADKFGVSVPTVLKIVKSKGLPIRSRGRPTPDTDKIHRKPRVVVKCSNFAPKVEELKAGSIEELYDKMAAMNHPLTPIGWNSVI